VGNSCDTSLHASEQAQQNTSVTVRAYLLTCLLTWLGRDPSTPPLQRLGASTAHGGVMWRRPLTDLYVPFGAGACT
jgi:hypothetical protein